MASKSGGVKSRIRHEPWAAVHRALHGGQSRFISQKPVLDLALVPNDIVHPPVVVSGGNRQRHHDGQRDLERWLV
jgi:hypothetical protein